MNKNTFDPNNELMSQLDNLPAVDLFQALPRKGVLTTSQMQELRDSVPIDQQENDLVAFMGTDIGRNHIRAMGAMLQERPYLTPEAVHHTILAQRLSAERLKRQQGETREQAEETMNELAS